MQSVTKSAKWFSFILAVWVSCLLVAGCTSTIIPKHVETHQNSFSGNDANGGFIGFTTNGFGVITENARTKYNALIDIYGGDVFPPIKHDFGITTFTNSTYLITKEALSDFAQMNRWKKDNKTP